MKQRKTYVQAVMLYGCEFKRKPSTSRTSRKRTAKVTPEVTPSLF